MMKLHLKEEEFGKVCNLNDILQGVKSQMRMVIAGID